MEMIDLLEEDREQLEQNLVRSASAADAQQVLEREIDNMLLRYNESCGDDVIRESAAAVAQTARTAMQMVSSAGEVRVWDRRSAAAGGNGSAKIPLAAVICLAAGVLLALGALIGSGAAAGQDSPGLILRSVPALICGGGLLFAAGRLSNRGKGDSTAGAKAAGAEAAQTQYEIRIDVNKAVNCMRAVAMVMDKNLKNAQEALAYERSRADGQEDGLSGMSSEETALLTQILEVTYSQRAQDPALQEPLEVIDSVRYYLHRKEVDVVEYSASHREWFELLPGKSEMTLRPALVKDGVLIRKGLACAGAAL